MHFLFFYFFFMKKDYLFIYISLNSFWCNKFLFIKTHNCWAWINKKVSVSWIKRITEVDYLKHLIFLYIHLVLWKLLKYFFHYFKKKFSQLRLISSLFFKFFTRNPLFKIRMQNIFHFKFLLTPFIFESKIVSYS